MLPLALTMGDPAGIGPEIALKAARDPRVVAVCRPVLYGPHTNGSGSIIYMLEAECDHGYRKLAAAIEAFLDALQVDQLGVRRRRVGADRLDAELVQRAVEGLRNQLLAIANRTDEVNNTIKATGDSIILDLDLRGSDVVSRLGWDRAFGDKIPAFTLHRASLTYSTDRYDLSLWANNIFDKYAYNSVGQDRSRIGINDGVAVRYYTRSVVTPRSVLSSAISSARIRLASRTSF